jgi:hypothetical protein
MRILLFLCTAVLSAQQFSLGVKGGVPATGDLDSYFATSESRRYVVGPMVTVGLSFGLRLEFDALYRRVGYRSADSDIIGDSSTWRERGNSWEFPILVRRTFWHGVYAGVGYAPRLINGSGHSSGIFVTSLSPPARVFRESDIPGAWETTHGVVGAAGIEKRIGPLHIAPEVRYTFWTSPAVNEFGSHGFSILSSQHQVDLLLGIRFP